jgi:uncharacterized protein (UPF0276 family)
MPASDAAIAIGVDRLRRLADAVELPIGLENLALAMSADDALEQGAFLEALLDPVGGFLVLDVHNVFCQASSFDLDADELLDRLPLSRAREIHVSGGSWHDLVPRFRRDTHDGPVPDEVFALLERALARCPGVEAVFLERLGGTFDAADAASRYRADFERMRAIVGAARG